MCNQFNGYAAVEANHTKARNCLMTNTAERDKVRIFIVPGGRRNPLAVKCMPLSVNVVDNKRRLAPADAAGKVIAFQNMSIRQVLSGNLSAPRTTGITSATQPTFRQVGVFNRRSTIKAERMGEAIPLARSRILPTFLVFDAPSGIALGASSLSRAGCNFPAGRTKSVGIATVTTTNGLIKARATTNAAWKRRSLPTANTKAVGTPRGAFAPRAGRVVRIAIGQATSATNTPGCMRNLSALDTQTICSPFNLFGMQMRRGVSGTILSFHSQHYTRDADNSKRGDAHELPRSLRDG